MDEHETEEKTTSELRDEQLSEIEQNNWDSCQERFDDDKD